MFAMPFLASFANPDVNFGVVAATLVMMGVSMGLNGISLFQLAAELNSGCLAGIFLGQGIGALILNLLRLYTLEKWPADAQATGLFKSTFVFYMTTGSFLTFLGIMFLC